MVWIKLVLLLGILSFLLTLGGFTWFIAWLINGQEPVTIYDLKSLVKTTQTRWGENVKP